MLGKELVGRELVGPLVLRLGKGPGRKEEERLLVFVGPLLRGFV